MPYLPRMDDHDVAPATAGTGTVSISRIRGRWAWRLRSFRILVDGQETTRIHWRETVHLPLAPGRHTLQARCDTTGTPQITITLDPGSTKHLFLRPNADSWKMFSLNPAHGLRWSATPDGESIEADAGRREPTGRWLANTALLTGALALSLAMLVIGLFGAQAFR